MFDDIRLAFIHPFLVQNFSGEEKLTEGIEELGLEIKTESEGIKDFKIAEFSLKEEYIKDILTLEIPGFEIELPNIEGNIPVKVFSRIHKKLNCFLLYFSLKLPKSTTDNLIFLKQSSFGRLKVSVKSVPDQLYDKKKNEVEKLSLKEILKKYQSLFSRAFNVKFQGETRSAIEIRKISNSSNNPREVLKSYPQQIYGLLVADEGWRFVPRKYAEKRISESSWTSRTFFVTLADASGTLNLNFRESKNRKKYLDSQKSIREKYGCSVEDYFSHDFEIAGTENGGLMLLEPATLESCVLSSLLQTKTPEEPLDIADFRKDIFSILDNMRPVKIPEAGAFAKKLRKKVSIPRYERLMERIDEIDRALDIKFSEERRKQDVKVSSRMQVLNVIFSGAVAFGLADLLRHAKIPVLGIKLSEWNLLIFGLIIWTLVIFMGLKFIQTVLGEMR